MPLLVAGKAWDGGKVTTINSDAFHPDKRTVTTSGVLNSRQGASTASEKSGPALAKTAKANILDWANGDEVEGERRWRFGDSGSRLWVGGTVEQPPQDKPGHASDTSEHGPVVLNGVILYPVGEKGLGRVVKTVSNANKRQWADTGSPSLGIISLDTDLTTN